MISDPAAGAAMRALSSALLGLLDHGTRPPCADGSGRWLSDDPEVRDSVMTQCDDCEIRDRCHAFASTANPRITCGIFGGVDFTAATRIAPSLGQVTPSSGADQEATR